MLEEITMEKKSSIWVGQGPSKGSSSEAKKLQDATAGKAFPKNGRKREPPNSNVSKFDQNRKPLPQKNKSLDKRPKPRGGLGYNSGRKENCQITDEEFESEFGFMFESGYKKQSLNHLLKFHYEPRGENRPGRVPSQSAHNFSTRALMATQAHKYNKEQFLQANCQFVVREGGDYSFSLGDPDLLVDWDHVELIITSSCEKVVCPICLFPPVAGKITRCGHIYCWSCILHYLALSDKSWRKCPICYESIHKKDLRSVECLEKALYSVGQKITMRLMKREKGTLVATPVSQFAARAHKPILSYGETEVESVYSKLLTASRKDVLDIISREYSELQAQVEEFNGCPELCFVEQALNLLGERKSLLETALGERSAAAALEEMDCGSEITQKGSSDTALPNEIASSPEESPPFFNMQACDQKRTTQRSESESAGSEGDEAINVSAEDLEIKNSNQAQKHFYFYQVADGQHVYLHSINVRLLEMTYGSLENCPLEISGKIIEKEAGSMTLPLRKRLRYLQHVPITCQFEVVELELKPPTVSPLALSTFKEQIDERRKHRQRQERAEKRREKKIEEAEMRRFSRRPDPNLRIESHFHFPEFGLEELPRPQPVRPDTLTCTSEMVESEEGQRRDNVSRSGSPSSYQRDKSPFSSAVAALSLESEESRSAVPSFTQVLREGKPVVSDGDWPSIGGTSNSRAIEGRAGGWGSSSSGGWGSRRSGRQDSVSKESVDSDDTSFFSPPAKPSFNIAEAIQLAASIERGDTSGSRKKKKKTQKILFTTGIPKTN